MSDPAPVFVLLETSMETASYDLTSDELRPIMMEKIANNVAKFGSLEAWLHVFRAEVHQKRRDAELKVNVWWTTQKQLEFVERHALTAGTEKAEGVDLAE